MKLSYSVLAISIGTARGDARLRGNQEELLRASAEKVALRGKTSCTGDGGDVWSTGSEVSCCAGLEKYLTHDYRWSCQPGGGGSDPVPVPTPSGPVPSSRGLDDLALCYGYGRANGRTIEEKVRADMAKVASCTATAGVQKIRTYFPSYFGLKKVTEFEGLTDKRLLPGFNPEDAEEWMTAIEGDLRDVYAADNVEAIIYLNERYESREVSWARNFINSMHAVRTNKPVLTSQITQSNYAAYTELLAQGFDGIMINIYPGRTFRPGGETSGDTEGDFNNFCAQLNEVQVYYATHNGRGEKFYGVSETGMPADPFGTEVSQAYFNNIKSFVAGERNCPQFSYDQLVDGSGAGEYWMGIYGFAATSEPNKSSALENSFGITDAFCPSEEGGDLASVA